MLSGRAGAGKRRSLAIIFVILLGLVSLLADVANEGTRSVIGPYLVLLGASATVVGIMAGLSEFIGYSLRIVFGWIADRTGRYWLPVFVGYLINLVAVPALALAGDWVMAFCLIMVERIGRAIRSPARDAMLSYSGKDVGRGWSYGLQEALSAVGGMFGPIVILLVMFVDGSYRLGFEVLVVPILIAMVLLVYAYRINPDPRRLEGSCPPSDRKAKFPRIYWLFVAAGALIACGYADFPLVAFHMHTFAGVTDGWIPVMYAMAMAANALAALLLGRLYDSVGIWPLVVTSVAVPFFVPLIFSIDLFTVVIGMMLYGVGLGAQESIMRAVVADISPYCRRGTAFGGYNAAFGTAWLLGSVTMGIVYDISLPAVIVLSMALQLASVPLLVAVMRRKQKLDEHRRTKEREAVIGRKDDILTPSVVEGSATNIDPGYRADVLLELPIVANVEGPITQVKNKGET